MVVDVLTKTRLGQGPITWPQAHSEDGQIAAACSRRVHTCLCSSIITCQKAGDLRLSLCEFVFLWSPCKLSGRPTDLDRS